MIFFKVVIVLKEIKAITEIIQIGDLILDQDPGKSELFSDQIHITDIGSQRIIGDTKIMKKNLHHMNIPEAIAEI